MNTNDRARDLDTRTLDRTIAERLGWRLIPVVAGSGVRKDHPDFPPEKLPTTETHYLIRAPQSVNSKLDGHSFATEEVAWLRITEQYPFSTDMNAAIELLGKEFSVHLIPYQNGQYGVYLEHLRTEHTEVATEDTPALAICRAWLAYTPPADAGGHAGDGIG